MDLLAKLKAKTASDIGNRLAAEKQNSVEGTVLVHLEKRSVHASSIENDLGIILNEQAEVRSVRPGYVAATNRVPVEHIVYMVNGVQCRSLGDVEMEVAKPVLSIVMKLFPLAPLRDLLVQYQQLPGAEDLKFEVLQRNPRFGFLQLFHPANGAWTRMYDQEKEARRLKYNLQRQLEAKKEEDALRHLEMLDMVSDEEPVPEPQPTVEAQPVPQPTVPQPTLPPRTADFIRSSAPAAMFQMGGAGAPVPTTTKEVEAPKTGEPNEDDDAVLHQLIQGAAVPVEAASLPEAQQQAARLPPPPFEEPVRYQLTPSKTYTLATGEQVSIPVTTRSGAVPQPPSAPMPQMTMEEYRRSDKRDRGDEKNNNGGGAARRGGHRHEGGGHRGGGGGGRYGGGGGGGHRRRY